LLSFETNDFVRVLGQKFYFNGDFTTDEDIQELLVTIRLPEGMVLSKDLISPPEGGISSDGRRIITVWKYSNVTSAQPLRFQIFYESTAAAVIPWKYVLLGAAIAGSTIFFISRRIRKPKEVILSVLDDYEKRVIDIITKSGGEVNQKKVVQETGLSKAKVSRVVKNLVNRGLVEVQRLGRVNKLKLVKKKFGF
jgi:predicted transcriptional regulator